MRSRRTSSAGSRPLAQRQFLAFSSDGASGAILIATAGEKFASSLAATRKGRENDGFSLTAKSMCS